jgi:hypothetical protein
MKYRRTRKAGTNDEVEDTLPGYNTMHRSFSHRRRRRRRRMSFLLKYKQA